MAEFGGASSIALALVALLWVGMLAPGWVRAHNLRASQKHAVRIQQTMRAMAHTAEAPEVLELEANARTVRIQRQELKRTQRESIEAERAKARVEAERRQAEAKLEAERAEQELRESQLRAEAWRLAAETREIQLEEERKVAEAAMADANARREAAARARAAAAAAEARESSARAAGETAADRWANGHSGSERAVERRLTGEQPTAAQNAGPESAARRRRGRLASTACGGAGLVAAIVGAFGLAAGWGIVVMIVGVALVAGSAWMLTRINSVWQAQLAAAPAEIAEPVAVAEEEAVAERNDLVIYDVEPEHVPAPVVAEEEEWTPVPVPRPLYLDRATASETPPDGPDDGTRVTDEDIMELLRDEARKSAQALRESHAGIPSIAPRAGIETAAAERIQPITVNSTSDWSSVGDLDALVGQYGDGELSNLDSVLRRRRAG